MERIWLVFLLVLFVSLGDKASGFSVEGETELRSDLFQNYSKSVRPDRTVIVELSITLTAIDFVDIKNQVFAIAGWWSIKWTDTRLSWTSLQYGNIPILQVLPEDMWTPALVNDNSIDNLAAIEEETIPLRITSAGAVTWNPPAISKTSCEMDITKFPFDTQICAIQVTSFGFSIQEVDIRVHPDGVKKTYYEESGMWDILQTWSDRETYEEDGYTYSKVYFYFEMERKPMYYGLNIVLPVMVNALLTMFVFLLPSDSGEKMGYSLTVMLAFMVILTLIAVDLPQTAKYTSILSVYIALILILGCLAVVLSILILYIHHLPEKKKIPRTVKRMANVAMYLTCRKKKKKVAVGPGGRHTKSSSSSSSSSSSDSDQEANAPRRTSILSRSAIATSVGRNTPVGDPLDMWYPGQNGTENTGQRSFKRGSQFSRNSHPVSSSQDFKSAEQKKKDKKKKKLKKMKLTWPEVASLVDAIMFRLYTVAFVCSTVVVFILFLM